MQIKNKKEVTLSSSTGTPTIVRRGNIASWDSTASKIFTKTDSDAGLFYQIGSSLKIESTGKPIKIKTHFTVATGNGSTQQQAFGGMVIGIKRVDIAGDYLTNSYFSSQTSVLKVRNAGNITDYEGVVANGAISITDRNPTVKGQIYEYQIVGDFIRCVGDSNSSIVTSTVSIANFEIEEVN